MQSLHHRIYFFIRILPRIAYGLGIEFENLMPFKIDIFVFQITQLFIVEIVIITKKCSVIFINNRLSSTKKHILFLLRIKIQLIYYCIF
jgi:hypothetical protein